jgi:hypothetical protein
MKDRDLFKNLNNVKSGSPLDASTLNYNHKINSRGSHFNTIIKTLIETNKTNIIVTTLN